MKSGHEKLETSLYRVVQNAFRLNRLGVYQECDRDRRTDGRTDRVAVNSVVYNDAR